MAKSIESVARTARKNAIECQRWKFIKDAAKKVSWGSTTSIGSTDSTTG